MLKIHFDRFARVSSQAAVALIMAGGFGGQEALADMTVVSSVSVTGLPADANSTVTPPAFPLTCTTYFQGEKSRMECSDGTVLIFDSDAGTVCQLDSKMNTYREETVKALNDYKSAFPSHLQRTMSIDSELYAGSSIDTASYLGTNTNSVPLSGTATITVVDSGPVRSEHFDRPNTNGTSNATLPGPVDAPGAGIDHPRRHIPSYTISGTIWEAPTDKLPKVKRAVTLPLAMQMVWGGPTFIANVAGQLDGDRQMVLHSDLTVTQTFSNPNVSDSSGSPTNTIETTFNVKSISTVPVAPALFTIPAGYTLDNAPINLPEYAPPPSDTGSL